MSPTVANNRDQIDAICRKHRVSRLELFGSAAEGSFDAEQSDVDFLVEFQPLAEGEHADAYFGLLDSLQTLLARPVDLVMTRAIRNRYFLEAIAKSRTLLYAD